MVSKPRGYEEELAQGWNITEYSMVLGPPHINVSSILMWDWSHTFISNGLADDEFAMLMKHFQVKKSECGFKDFRCFMESWSLPAARAVPDRLFTDEQIKLNLSKSDFSCGASDFLNLSPIILKYLREVARPRGQCLEHIECMVACLEALELLQATKGGRLCAQRLEDRGRMQ